MCQNSTMLWHPGREVEDLVSLKDKINRITNYLKELKTLSKSCQELITVTPQIKNEEYGERQVFVRRIVQLRAEIEDCRDLILLLCKKFMSLKQWRIMEEDFQVEVDCDELDCERSGIGFGWGVLSGLIDPSVRFFGMDWESMFQRCTSISNDVKVLGDTLHNGTTARLDSPLVNKILKDLASIEADVNSHAEAVLQGRLSKSQRKLIHREQLKYSSVGASKHHEYLPNQLVHSSSPSPLSKKSGVPKSQSFCDQNKCSFNQPKTPTLYKFKRSKTSGQVSKDLDFYQSESHWTKSPEKRVNFFEDSSFNTCDEQQKLIDRSAATLITTTNSRGAVVTVISSKTSTALADMQFSKKKSSFLQNLSLMLKNIR